MRTPFRLGLFGKIVLSLCLVGLLPLGLVSYRLININRGAFASQVLRMHALAADGAASGIAGTIDSYWTVARSAAGNPTISLAPGSPEARQQQVDLLAAGNEQLVAVASFNSDDTLIMRAHRKEVSHLAEDLLKAGPPGSVVLLPGENHSWLVISTRFSQGGDLRLLVKADRLAGLLVPNELGNHAKMVLVSQDGSLLLGAPGTDVIPSTLLARGASQRLSGSGQFPFKDTTILGAHAPVSGLPWMVLSWQPLEEAYAIAKNMRRQALESLGLALAITALLSGLAYAGLVKPIRNLIDLANSGDEDGGNEIEKLQHAFETLTKNVADREQFEDVFLGRYQVLQKVGEGGMGMVFQGWDPQLQRPLAIKTIRLESFDLELDSVAKVSELLNEAVTVARLNHPNIVTIFDVVEANHLAYVAMEYVDGASLEAYLVKGGTIPPQSAIPLFLGIAQGIEAAHGQGILHRDIKPANILLGRNNSIKISDFGISQFMNSLANDEEQIFGTPGFISPEALQGGTFSFPGDLFALGITIYITVSGHLPFESKNIIGLIHQTVRSKHTPLHELNPAIPMELSLLVDKLLEKNPADRPAIGSVIEELEGICTETWSFSLTDEKGASEEDPDGFLASQFFETVDLHS